jgi:hypothetical protein
MLERQLGVFIIIKRIAIIFHIMHLQEFRESKRRIGAQMLMKMMEQLRYAGNLPYLCLAKEIDK